MESLAVFKYKTCTKELLKVTNLAMDKTGRCGCCACILVCGVPVLVLVWGPSFRTSSGHRAADIQSQRA